MCVNLLQLEREEIMFISFKSQGLDITINTECVEALVRNDKPMKHLAEGDKVYAILTMSTVGDGRQTYYHIDSPLVAGRIKNMLLIS